MNAESTTSAKPELHNADHALASVTWEQMSAEELMRGILAHEEQIPPGQLEEWLKITEAAVQPLLEGPVEGG